MVSDESVNHDKHSNEAEHASRDFADLVTEIEQSDSETAEDDSEM